MRITADYYLEKVEQYRDEETKKGRPKNEPLIARIEKVQLGKVRSLFTDSQALFPAEGHEVWWEVWLRKERYSYFCRAAEVLNIQTQPNKITFPEREIVLVMTTAELIAQILENSGAIAELRIAKDTPSMFLEMGPCEQGEWVEELAERLIEPESDAVAICMLDSGVTRSHRLLGPGLAPDDMHTVDPTWSVGDSHYWNGHGTAMAGIALYQDLCDALTFQNGQVQLPHRLESVKILPNTGQNDPKLYGAITGQGISLPEIKAPERHRIFCMAVTSNIEATDSGVPS